MKYIKTYEYRQLADKIYFNTDKLNQNDRNIIYDRITQGDNTTKIISDMYFRHKDDWNIKDVIKNLKDIHNQLLNYNKNVIPIKDFDMLNKDDNDYYYSFINRGKILDRLKELPSVAIRNMKEDIRKPRDSKELDDYRHSIEYFSAQYSQLYNRDEKFRKKIHDKMFKSNITLEDLLRFAHQKENLLGGVEYSKDDVIKMVDDSYVDMTIIYDENDVLVVKVESAEAIKNIGCNSFWCFTYGQDNYRSWSNFCYHGMVYVIINFKLPSDDPEFMYILIKPLEKQSFYKKEENDYKIPLFNMANENYFDPYPILTDLVGKKNIKKIFTFE